jgi:hypothetical protein
MAQLYPVRGLLQGRRMAYDRRVNWLSDIVRYLATSDTPSGRARDLARYDMGVCPGCRGLRAVASDACRTCGSVVAVTADA